MTEATLLASTAGLDASKASGAPSAIAYQPPLLVTATEARRMLGIGNSKFWLLVGAGTIETVPLGRRRMVRFSCLQRIAAEGAK